MPNDEILNELKKITKLLAVLATKDTESKKEQILKLSSLGFQANEISEITNVAASNVRTTLSKSIKKKKLNKKK